VLFSVSNGDSSSGLQLTRLLALLNNASGALGMKEGAAFVDLDAVPEDGLSLSEGMKLFLSDKAESLRNLLEDELENIADVLSRQILRKGMTEAVVTLTPPRPPTLPFLGDILSPPKVQLDDIPFPFLLPGGDGDSDRSIPSVSLMTASEFTDLIAPKLSRDEEIYAIGIADAIEQFAGEEAANFFRGENLVSTQTAQLVLTAATTGMLGNANLLGTPAARSTLNSASDVLRRLDGNTSGTNSVDKILTEATLSLTTEEKQRLDMIVTKLTERLLKRVRTRIATKN